MLCAAAGLRSAVYKSEGFVPVFSASGSGRVPLIIYTVRNNLTRTTRPSPRTHLGPHGTLDPWKIDQGIRYQACRRKGYYCRIYPLNGGFRVLWAGFTECTDWPKSLVRLSACVRAYTFRCGLLSDHETIRIKRSLFRNPDDSFVRVYKCSIDIGSKFLKHLIWSIFYETIGSSFQISIFNHLANFL